MGNFPREFLELLSEKYPNEAAVCTELINLNSILALPKGTEHFISDLHGEYESVRHILNNCSGVILEKVRILFEDELGDSGCHALCSIIYYPREELKALRARGVVDNRFLRETIERMRSLAESLSSKYTRGYVRKQIPEGWARLIDELLHLQINKYENQVKYRDRLIDSILSTGSADEIIASLAELIKNLAVDRLHVVGDIFDRGPNPAGIVELLMKQPIMDIQWGNHDILWIGAAAGCPACITTVLRISVDYENIDILERDYGISMRYLIDFCERVYGSADKVMQKQAVSLLGAKLEGRIIKRHPGYEMNSRLMLEQVDWQTYSIELDGIRHPLNTQYFPTIDPSDPYKLTADEEELVNRYVAEFSGSHTLRRHMDFIYEKGSTYLCCNGNLLYHGCIPLNENGTFASVRHGGIKYSGKALMDFADTVVRSAWKKRDRSALDMMWYLWCGKDSPFSGRIFHTFERAYIDDKATWAEPKNPYFGFWEDASVISMILSEFGLDPNTGHIINGHTPIKAAKGESPVKADGRLFIIDGGFCKAYQKTTGIAGYTLIYSSNEVRLKSHRPFEGVAKVLSDDIDIESDSVPIEIFEKRLYIADTDKGEKLNYRIDALNSLLQKYRSGEFSQL